MKNHNLQYINETLILEELNQLEFGLNKKAGILEDLGLPEVASTVYNYVAGFLKNLSKDSDGPGELVLSLLVPGVLFRIHPLLGIFWSIAKAIGFDIESVFTDVRNAISGKLSNNEQVSPDELTGIAQNSVSKQAGPYVKTNFNDFNSFIKTAQRSRDFLSWLDSGERTQSGQSLPKIPWLRGEGGIVGRIFGQLFQKGPGGVRTAKWLIGGVIIWLVKTVLLSAGMLMGAGALVSFVKNRNDKTDKTESRQEISENESTSKYEENEHDALKTYSPPSLQKEKLVVPMGNNQTIEDLLISWIKDLYPLIEKFDVFDKDIVIKEVPSFMYAVSLFSNERILKYEGQKVITVPEQFSKPVPKQVVELFIKDVIQALKNEENKL